MAQVTATQKRRKNGFISGIENGNKSSTRLHNLRIHTVDRAEPGPRIRRAVLRVERPLIGRLVGGDDSEGESNCEGQHG